MQRERKKGGGIGGVGGGEGDVIFGGGVGVGGAFGIVGRVDIGAYTHWGGGKSPIFVHVSYFKF